MNKNLLRSALLLQGLLSCLAIAAETPGINNLQKIDRIIAVVNGDVITEFELNDLRKTATQELAKQGTALPPADIFDKQLLERLINDKVLMLYAKETGVRVDDLQLDQAIRRIAESNNLTMETFRKALEKDGINFAKFREEIRHEMVTVRIREREVENRLVVTEAEVDNFLAAQKNQPGKQEQYNLAHILVTVPEKASPEQIRERQQRAEQALAQLQGGKEFAQVAAGYSDASDALQGGFIGWRDANRLPTIFAESIQQLKVGQSSGILRSANGFHIIKLLERRGNSAPTVINQTHARHILIKTNEVVSETDAKNRLVQVKERIDHGSDFGEMARLHSDDGSASKNGDLGWISPGDTVPEFERAMDALKVGQVSEPVRSPFGWHLLQVIERRQEDVSADRQRLQARQAIRARKADEQYLEWLRQLRDRAYVEYRLEER